MPTSRFQRNSNRRAGRTAVRGARRPDVGSGTSSTSRATSGTVGTGGPVAMRLYDDLTHLYDIAFSWDLGEEVDWLTGRLGAGVMDVLHNAIVIFGAA